MPRNSGFTLIEVLISMVIFMMVMSLIIFSFSQSLSLWERADKEIEKLDQMVFLDAWVKDVFHSAENVPLRIRGKTAPFFIGTRSKVLFLTLDPIVNKTKIASFARIEFTSGGVVYAEENLFKSDLSLLNPSEIEFKKEHPLLSDVEEGRLSYLVPEGRAWIWKGEIDSQVTFNIPKAVKMEFLHQGQKVEILAYIGATQNKWNPSLEIDLR